MDYFTYQNNVLCAEQVPLPSIIQHIGSPCYVYSRAAISNQWKAFDTAFGNIPHRICYAVKANSNIGILKLLAELNSGFDIVSQGELERVIAAGGDPQKIVFSGVGKHTDEIKRALEVGIYCFNVESESELQRLNAIAAEMNLIAQISLRINPNIDAKTHPYIATGLHENKFGLELSSLPSICAQIKNLPNVKLISIGCHIGSQLTDMEPFIETLDCLRTLVKQFSESGIELKNLNIGGGLGIHYRDEQPPTIKDYVDTIINKVGDLNLEIIIEPGRIIVGNAGILVTRVEYLKHTPYKNFAVVDAAMNDLVRPALYKAWHEIKPIMQNSSASKQTYDIVGPVCESADFLAKQRVLALQPNDLLALFSVGAYGFSMSSNYNSRPRPAEVLVDGQTFSLIRKRESLQDLYIHELNLE